MMKKAVRLCLCSVLVLLCCYSVSAQTFSLPPDPLPRPPNLQVDQEGRAFVAAGSQLLRLSSSLVPEQIVNLSSVAVNISLSSGGEWLVVCTTDLSCAVHNASDLTAVSSTSEAALVSTNRVAVFTAGNSFYVGSAEVRAGDDGEDLGDIRLRQAYGLDGSGVFERSTDYTVTRDLFQRDFFAGFISGSNVYYIVTDHNPPNVRAIRIMRACHVTGCPGGSPSCGFTALYEENIIGCGGPLSDDDDDTVCGVSVVEDFAEMSGTSILISRCRVKSVDNNLVCLVHLSDVVNKTDSRYDQCSAGNGESELAWRSNTGDIPCNGIMFRDRCDFTEPLDDVQADSIADVTSSPLISIGSGGVSTMSASVAVQIDDFSLMIVAYILTAVSDTDSTYFIAMFQVTDASVTLSWSDALSTRQVSSQVRALQWQRGLEYFYAATDTEILKLPIDECWSSEDCSSCIMSGNPLCGWCVVENRCSRQSHCRDGWINPSTQCILNTVTPNQYLVDSPQVLSVSVGGPGLPSTLENETYLCHLEDSEGRFPPIIVSAVEVTPGTGYTCNITSQIPDYDGVLAVMDFSFVSSLVGVPLDTTKNALTIFRCSSASQCADCLETGNMCGWCEIRSICSGQPQDCINTTNFLQLSGGETFEDVCPVLDLMDGTNNYTQHVRVQTSLQLTTRNLPDTPQDFSYSCSINGVQFSAVRSDTTSLTCQIPENMLMHMTPGVSSEVTDINVFWIGPNVTYIIDVLYDARVTVYDCNLLGSDCSSCVLSRSTPGFECGWCTTTSSCDVECSDSVLLIEGTQCPVQTITSFSPTSGPPSGGTLITIAGTNLGVTTDDFDPPSGITVGGVSCTPLSMGYESGHTVQCRTGSNLPEGPQQLVIRLERGSGQISVPATENFMVVMPTISSVEPKFGPIAGGSELRITGTGLDISSSVRVTLGGVDPAECLMVSRSVTVINCTTPSVSSPSTSHGVLVIHIDNERTSNNNVFFSYTCNPVFTAVHPQFTIPAGGVTLTFTGSNLDVAQNPQLVINGISSPCTAEDRNTLTCIAPAADNDTLSYMLILDDAPFPDEDLELMLRPNPTGFKLITESVVTGSTALIQIEAQNLDSIVRAEIRVIIGYQACEIFSITPEQNNIMLLCEFLFDVDDRIELTVDVYIGSSLNFTLDSLILNGTPEYNIVPTIDWSPLVIILVFTLCAIVILCCCVCVCIVGWRNKATKKKLSAEINKLQLTQPIDGNRINNMVMEELVKALPAKLIISASEVRILDISLGQGQFGMVYKGHLVNHQHLNTSYTEDVAVKILKSIFSRADIQSMLSEVVKMSELSHPNIMSVVGVCVDSSQGPSIVMPYMANGSLLDYLKKERKGLYLDFDAEIDAVQSVRKLLLRMCHQISLGMAYLALQKIIHRDLAARNCMLDSKGIIKVADFGLSEDVYTASYFRQSKDDPVKLPFKWMAPESLSDGLFNQKTDVVQI